MNLVYRVGSRHEGSGEAGMAHLLEHMLFKGTAAYPDPKKEFTERGMRWNGTTSYDRTNYYAQFTASPQDERWMLGWFADTMSNIRITAEQLDSERPVVRNEMQSSENRPQRLLFQQLMGRRTTSIRMGAPSSATSRTSPACNRPSFRSFYDAITGRTTRC